MFVGSGDGWDPEGLDTLTPHQRRELATDLERQRRLIEARLAAVVNAVDRNEDYADDGHASMRGWLRAELNVADVDATGLLRTAALVRDHAEVAELLEAGRIGVGQVRRLGAAHANPRVADRFA